VPGSSSRASISHALTGRPIFLWSRVEELIRKDPMRLRSRVDSTDQPAVSGSPYRGPPEARLLRATGDTQKHEDHGGQAEAIDREYSSAPSTRPSTSRGKGTAAADVSRSPSECTAGSWRTNPASARVEAPHDFTPVVADRFKAGLVDRKLSPRTG